MVWEGGSSARSEPDRSAADRRYKLSLHGEFVQSRTHVNPRKIPAPRSSDRAAEKVEAPSIHLSFSPPVSAMTLSIMRFPFPSPRMRTHTPI